MSALIVALHRAELLEAHDPLIFLSGFFGRIDSSAPQRRKHELHFSSLVFSLQYHGAEEVGVSFVCTRVCL